MHQGRGREAATIFILAFLSSMWTGGCQAVRDLADTEVGSGTSATQERSVGSFDSLHSRTSIRVEVTVGPPVSVKVSADDNLIDRLVTEVEGSTLVVHWTGSISTRSPAVVTVTMPTLSSLEADSSSRIVADDLSIGRLTIDASSSASVAANGTADAIDVSGSSSSDLRLSELIAQRATVDLSSSARAALQVVDHVSGGVSSSATLTLVGRPNTVEVDTSSSGQVVQQ